MNESGLNSEQKPSRMAFPCVSVKQSILWLGKKENAHFWT